MTSTDSRPVELRPLGGYAAKQCPVRLQNDLILSKEMRDETPPGLRLRALCGNDFEDEIVDLFKATQSEHAGTTTPTTAADSRFGSWVFLELGKGQPRGSLEVPTLRAMNDGAPVIVNGRLPTDHEGHRVGEPDLLIRYGDHQIDGSWRYLAVDIKHHKTLNNKDKNDKDKVDGAAVSVIGDPFYESRDSFELPALMAATNKNDLLQLAHYTRMLEACGHSAPEKAGGILGKERLIVWYDLDTEIHTTRSNSDPEKKTKKPSALVRYDHEFGFRIDVAQTATAVANGDLDSESLMVEPRRSAECDNCPWRTRCRDILEQHHDVSLIESVTYNMWRDLRASAVGVRCIEDLLEAMPMNTARLLEVFGVGSLQKLVDKCQKLDREGGGSMAASGHVRSNANKQIEVLNDLELSVADVAKIDGFSQFRDSTAWTKLLLNGSAVLGNKLVYAKEGAVPGCLRFDIEVDIDMENTVDDRVYLWGCYVTVVGNPNDPRNGYHPFFQPDIDETTERVLFEEFWKWFTGLRQVAADNNQTIGAYCWSGGAAENRRMTDLAAGNDELAKQVEEFIASGSWVDLEKSFKRHYRTGRGSGLKKVAPAAGFNWRAPDAGGDTSLSYYEKQLPPTKCHYGRLNRRTRKAARRWLLQYNEDDCRATKAVREQFTNLDQTTTAVPATRPDTSRLAKIWHRISRAIRRS